ncbi:MAG: septation protein SepH [Actinomycetota bacterium]|nr:septation protein SepH [Actinomycetota bacterium]
MIELQLVGYTADLKYLVFCDAGETTSRFKAPVDDELLATLTEVMQLVEPDRAGLLVPAPPELMAPPPPETEQLQEPGQGDGHHRVAGQGPVAGLAVLVPAQSQESGNGQAGEALRPRESKLSPREIQALLRAGKSPRTVAKQAETDEAWVRRWLPPIQAERGQIIQAVQQARVVKDKLGPSRDLLGEAVRKNLVTRGVAPGDESIEWIAARGAAEASWKVTLRFRSHGRRQSAVWRFDPESGDLESRNELAADLSWTRSRKSSRPAKSAGGKKAAPKTTTARAGGKKVAPETTTAGAAPDTAAPDKSVAGKRAGKAGKKTATRPRKRSTQPAAGSDSEPGS